MTEYQKAKDALMTLIAKVGNPDLSAIVDMDDFIDSLMAATIKEVEDKYEARIAALERGLDVLAEHRGRYE